MHRAPALAIALLLVATSAGATSSHGRGPHSGGTTGGGGGLVSGGTTSGPGAILAVLPDGSLRELCTAFTEVTESPFTLDDGHGAWSLDAAAVSWAKLDTIRSRGVDAGGISYTRGLPGRWDVEASVATWSDLGLTTGPVNGEVRPSGFGGGALKVRHNFFGVDSAGAALGAVATLWVPGASTSPRSTDFEGALALPASLSAPLDFTLSAMVEGAVVTNAASAGHHARWIESLKHEHDLAPALTGWVEGVSAWDREPGRPWLGSVNGGVSADLWGHVAFDVGVAAGWSAGTTDRGLFTALGVHY